MLYESISYLNKLVDRYNNTYHHCINKKAVSTGYSVLTEKNWDEL